jgi:hypothetical protein
MSDSLKQLELTYHIHKENDSLPIEFQAIWTLCHFKIINPEPLEIKEISFTTGKEVSLRVVLQAPHQEVLRLPHYDLSQA